ASAKWMLMAVECLPAATAATISRGSASPLGLLAGEAAPVDAVGCSGVGSPQPARAANNADTVSARMRWLLMELGQHQGTSAAHTNRRIPSADQRQSLSRKNGGIIHGAELLEQVGDVPLPEARIAKPRKGAGERRIVPARGDPCRVMQDAKTAQCLDQRQFGEVELTKQFVTFHDRGPRRLLARGISGEKHPQILDAR